MDFAPRDNKSFDIIVRKFGDDTKQPIAMRSIRFYGHREKSVDEVLEWLKEKLGVE